MRFVMYTEKNIPQTMKAINDRLHVPGTKSRPQIDGWVEKSGRFVMAVTTTVHGRFKRKTVLRGQADREDGITVVRGTVPGGLSRRRQMIIFGIIVATGILALAQGSAIVAIITILVGAAMSIPLQGDFDNSEFLLTELQRTLKARFTPPRP